MTLKSTISFTRLIFACFVLLATAGKVQAQCAVSAFNTGNITPLTGAFQTISVGPGTYAIVNLKNGGTYRFSHCASSHVFTGTGSNSNTADTQLSLWNGGTNIAYNDDNGVECTSNVRASLDYVATYSGTANLMTNRFNCFGFQSAAAGNSVTLSYRCYAGTNLTADGTAGSNAWNVFAYNSTTIGTNYTGYYTSTALDFNTTSRFAAAGVPSDANATGGAGYLGCAITADAWSLRYVRTGFPCGIYTITGTWDDNYSLLRNGTQIASGTCCANSNAAVASNVFLGTNTTLEFRLIGTGGGENGGLTFSAPTALAINSSAADMCEGATRTLTANAAGGTFSGTGVSGTTFTAPAQADGTNFTDYVITYTLEGCTATQTIRVYNTLAFTSVNTDMCEGGTRTLTASTPAATFSGTGVSGTTFTAPAQSAGTNFTDYTITATHTGNACGTTTTQTIRVYNTIAFTSSAADMCEGGTRTLTTGNPAATFSGTGVSGTTFTAPAQADGTNFTDYTITATHTGNACGTTATQTIRVYNTLTFTSASTDMCEGGTRTLTASTPAATFSGTGVSGSTFTAPAQTSGTNFTDYTITATYTGNACGTPVTQTIRVWNAQAFTSAATDMCEAGSRTLTTTTPNSTFSGTGVSGSTFTAPAQADGTNFTDYTITATSSGNSCGTTTTQTIRVYNTLTFTSSAADLCEGGTRALTASTPATTFSGTGVSGTTFTAPAQADGTDFTDYTITATHTGNACGTTATQTIRVWNTPSITSSSADLCEGAARTLTHNLGGASVTWSGTGVSGNTFTAPAQSDGTDYTDYTITLTRNGISGCNSATQTIRVWNTPNITSSSSDICESSTRQITHNLGGSASVSYSASAGSVTFNAGTYTFNPPALTPPTQFQDVVITLTRNGVSGCNTATQTIRVYNTPTFSSSGSAMCEGQTRILTSGVTGTTFSGSDVTFNGTNYILTAPNPGGTSSNSVITATNGACSALQIITIYPNNTITESPTGTSMCEGATRTLSASFGPGVFSGTGVSGITFTAPTPAGNSQIYTVSYQQIGSPCIATLDFTVYHNPSASVPGSNFSACGLTTNFAATAPTFGTGTWTLDAGPGTATYGNANSATSSVTVTAYGTYTFRWTVANGSCASTSNTVQITFYQPVTSNAGSNFSICGTSGNLAGNVPVAGTGTWTQDSGPSVTVFSNANANNSPIAVSAYGTYVYRWTVVNGTCNATSTVSVTFDEPVTANAGPSLQNCNDPVFYMNASTPLVGTGIWTILIGTGNIVTPASTTTEVNSIPSNATTTLRWTVTNGACQATSDATVTNWANPTTSAAGSDIVACASLTTTLAGNTPTTGTGTWTQVAGFGSTSYAPNANTSNATITNTSYGVFTYRWTITNGTCPVSEDDVDVVFNAPITLTAGKDECLSRVGSNDSDYVYLTASGGTSPFTFTDVTGTGEQKVFVSNAQRVFTAPMTGAAHNYGVSDLWGCTQTASITTSVTHPTDVPYTSTSGSLNADCYVSYFNNWTTFRDGSNDAILSLNDYDQDLGLVNVTLYKDPTIPYATGTAGGVCAGTQLAAMQRHFVITSSIAPVNKVGLRLYFTANELDSLIAASTGNDIPNNTCSGDDNITNINELYVTKYTGLGEDGDYNNNVGGVYRVFGDDNVNLPGGVNGGLAKSSGGFTGLFQGGAANHYVFLEVNEFSEIWLNGSLHNQALPVQLTFFEANAVNNSYIQLRWATALEIDNDGFTIERSTDGINFTEIGWKDGHDNSTVVNNYDHNDYNVEPNRRYYYRLKQVDNDGDFEYTSIVSAIIGGEFTMTVKDFVPNPSSGNTSLIITSVVDQQPITVEIYNLLGEKVLQNKVTLIKGGNKIDFDLGTLAAGTYTATVSSANEVYSRKLVITK
jgi:hypothetical protein